MFPYTVVTRERTVRKGQATSVTAMTDSGEVTILEGHISLLGSLRSGMVTIKTTDGEEFFAVSTGFLEVRPSGEVILLADTAEHADELDETIIKKAQEEAVRVMTEKRHIDEEAYAHAAAALERELAREKVFRRKRH